jgi:site-specific recombinase XerC
LLGKFTAWAATQNLTDWKSVELKHLMAFLQHERARPLADEPKESSQTLEQRERLSGNRRAAGVLPVCRERKIAAGQRRGKSFACRAGGNGCPRRCRTTKSKNCSRRKMPETPESLCDQAVLELAYASGLRLSELKNLRLEQLHLDAGFINVIGKGNKERVVPVGRQAVEALNRYIEPGGPSSSRPNHRRMFF